MPDSISLKPDDPTPDPEKPAPHKATTWKDMEAARLELEGDPADEADGAPKKKSALPLGHHLISEVRRLLVPIITSLIAAAAAGGFVEWRASAAKNDAVLEAESRIDKKIKQANEASRELERLRTEIRKAIIKDASWDDVGTLQADEAAVLRAVMGTVDLPPALNDHQFKGMFQTQLQELRAQSEFPPRPAAGH